MTLQPVDVEELGMGTQRGTNANEGLHATATQQSGYEGV